MSLTMPAEEEVAQHEGNIGSSIANQREKNQCTDIRWTIILHSAASNSVPLNGGCKVTLFTDAAKPNGNSLKKYS